MPKSDFRWLLHQAILEHGIQYTYSPPLRTESEVEKWDSDFRCLQICQVPTRCQKQKILQANSVTPMFSPVRPTLYDNVKRRTDIVSEELRDECFEFSEFLLWELFLEVKNS